MVAAHPGLDFEELAQLLQDIADNGADAFYTGDVADDIVETVSVSTGVYCSTSVKDQYRFVTVAFTLAVNFWCGLDLFGDLNLFFLY